MHIVKAKYEIDEFDALAALKKLERIGRICYKSEGAITGESYKSFIKKLIDRGHEAMLEHIVITVIIECDRGVSHELVRHRIASFAQESTRYCNYSKDKFENSIRVVDLLNGIQNDPSMQKLDSDQVSAIIEVWLEAQLMSERAYLRMLELGASPQIARSALTNSLATSIAVTMNPRGWRNFFSLRTPETAHPQMRELAVPMLADFKAMMPIMFDDIPDYEGVATSVHDEEV